MKFCYGGYEHAPGEVNLEQMELQPVFSPRNRRWVTKKRLHIRGELQPTPTEEATFTTNLLRQAWFDAKITALKNAYDINFQSGGLKHGDGTLTRHWLDNNQANNISGVRVAYRSWPRGAGDEYVTARTYYIILEAIFDEADSGLLDFRETLHFVGNCGQKWQAIEHPTGIPTSQVLCLQTTQTIIQTGAAVGNAVWPLGNVPPPLFPALEHQDRRRMDMNDPTFMGNQHRNFPVTWTYYMEAATPQSAVPNVSYL